MSDLFKTVEIEINHNCNLSCSYCPNEKHQRVEKGLMSEITFKTLLQQLRELKFNGSLAYSFYSEPTLSPNLESFIRLSKRELSCARNILYSNGILLNEEKIFGLSAAGVDQFIITQHKDVERDDFNRTLNRLNEEIKRKILFRSFDSINLTNRGGLLPHVQNNKDLTFLPCLIPIKMLTVTLKGNVLPCFEDFYQVNQMGNILETHLKDIWNSQKYLKFRMDLQKGLRHNYSVCRDCNRFEVL